MDISENAIEIGLVSLGVLIIGGILFAAMDLDADDGGDARISSRAESYASPISAEKNRAPIFQGRVERYQEKAKALSLAMNDTFYQTLNMSHAQLRKALDYRFMQEGFRPIRSIGVTFEDTGVRDVAYLSDGKIERIKEQCSDPAEFEISVTQITLQKCIDMQKAFSVERVGGCMGGMNTEQNDIYNEILNRACIANFGSTIVCMPFLR